MSLVGNMIATSAQGDPAIVNYDMFVAIFAMGSLLYLVLATFVERVYHGKVVFGLEALNALFFFCGAVATAAYLGVHSCSNIVSCVPTSDAGLTDTSCRNTLAAISLRMVRPTHINAALRRKLQRHSSSSASSPLSHLSSCRGCTQWVVAAAVSEALSDADQP
jgi:hypothetical protein